MKFGGLVGNLSPQQGAHPLARKFKAVDLITYLFFGMFRIWLWTPTPERQSSKTPRRTEKLRLKPPSSGSELLGQELSSTSSSPAMAAKIFYSAIATMPWFYIC